MLASRRSHHVGICHLRMFSPSLILCSTDTSIPFHLARTKQNLESIRDELDSFPTAYASFVGSLCLNGKTWGTAPKRIPVDPDVYQDPSTAPPSCFRSGFDEDSAYQSIYPYYITQQPLEDSQSGSNSPYPESNDAQDSELDPPANIRSTNDQVHSSKASDVSEEADCNLSGTNDQNSGDSSFSYNKSTWQGWDAYGIWHMRLPPDTIVMDNVRAGTSRTFPFLVASDSLSLIPIMTSVLYHRYVWCVDAPLIGIELSTTNSCLKVHIGWLESRGDEPVGLDSLFELLPSSRIPDFLTTREQPRVHIARASDEATTRREGIYDMRDPDDLRALAHFVLSLHDQVGTFTTTMHSPRIREFCWRLDHYVPFDMGGLGWGGPKMVSRWRKLCSPQCDHMEK